MHALEPIQTKTRVVCQNKKKYDNFHHVHSRKGLSVLQSGDSLFESFYFFENCIVLYFFGFEV